MNRKTSKNKDGTLGSAIGTIVWLCLLSVVLAGNADAAPLLVYNNNDNGAGSLRQALADNQTLGGGNTITFSNVVTGSIHLTGGQLAINTNVTITGPGAAVLTIDGNASSRVFYIGSNAVVAISGLIVSNGLTTGPNFPGYAGGGIYVDHASLTVVNCNLNGNVSSNYIGTSQSGEFTGLGGGIYNDHSTLIMSGCVFKGNLAGTRVVSVSANTPTTGGGIYSDNGITTVTDTTFNGNSANEGGSGIMVVGGTLSISACTLTSNLFSYNVDSGSGIRNSGGTVTVSNCTLTANAGGIRNESGAVATIVNSTFSGNNSHLGAGIDNAAKATIAGCTFNGNSAFYGAAIFNEGGDATTINCTFTGNAAVQSGPSIFNVANMTNLNCTFSGNSCQFPDGDIHNNGLLVIGSSIFNAGNVGVNITNLSSITSLGYNLSSDSGGGGLTSATDKTNTNPQLGPLQDNGGPCLTMALLANSPAIDKGKSFGSTTDARGKIRPADLPSLPNAAGGDGSDIGAFEYYPSSPVLSIQSLATNVVLSWSTNSAGFRIESETNLAGANWTSVSGTPAKIGTQFNLTNSAGSSVKFYRLTFP